MRINHKEATERIREIYKELKIQKRVKFNRDFLGITGLSDSQASRVLNDNSDRAINFPRTRYEILINHWDINPDYLFHGKLPMFLNEKKDFLEEINNNLLVLIDEIRKLNAR